MPVLRPGLPIRPPLGPLLLRVLLFLPRYVGRRPKGEGRYGTAAVQLGGNNLEYHWTERAPTNPLFRRWDASHRKRGERLPCVYAQLMTPTIALCS